VADPERTGGAAAAAGWSLIPAGRRVVWRHAEYGAAWHHWARPKLERFADAHALGEIVFAPREIGAQINVELLAQQKTNAGASGRQELIRAEAVAARSNFADAAKANQAQTPREDQAIFQLSGKHVAIEVTPRGVAA
jgi:hypothetical protein